MPTWFQQDNPSCLPIYLPNLTDTLPHILQTLSMQITAFNL